MGDFHSQPQLWASSISADLRLPLSNMPQSSDLNRFEWCLRWCTQPLLFALWDQSVLHCTSFMALSTRRLVAPSVNLHCGHYGRQPGTPLALFLARQVPSCLGIQFLMLRLLLNLFISLYISAIGFIGLSATKRGQLHGIAETNGTNLESLSGGWPYESLELRQGTALIEDAGWNVLRPRLSARMHDRMAPAWFSIFPSQFQLHQPNWCFRWPWTETVCMNRV